MEQKTIQINHIQTGKMQGLYGTAQGDMTDGEHMSLQGIHHHYKLQIVMN